ncbi:MAG: hypothetical protein Q4F95_04470 [Oscillospiraceae bacterium]|nr:hypothetical protein [Oscillospiraceae bacterium]
MAKKDNYSIDDILDEYSIDEERLQTPAEPDSSLDSIIGSSDEESYIAASREDEEPDYIQLDDLDTDDSDDDDELSLKLSEETVSEESAQEEAVLSEEPEAANETDEQTAETITAGQPAVPEKEADNDDGSSIEIDVKENDTLPEPAVSPNFIDRSATRITDKPNKIVENPCDNIRYIKKVSDTPRETADTSKKKRFKKKKDPETLQTKSDLYELKNDVSSEDYNSRHDFTSVVECAANSFRQTAYDIFRQKSVSQKDAKINVKSTPDVDFFSIDVQINENTDDPALDKKRKQKVNSFFNELNKNSGKEATRQLDDYNTPGDSSIILDDLYNLKSNLSAKLIVQIIAALISIYLSAAPLYSLPVFKSFDIASSPHTYGFAMFLISAIVLFSSLPIITNGLKNIIKKKADCDSLVSLVLTISTIAAAASTSGIELLQNQNIYIFTPVAITAFLINTLGKNLIVSRAINNFDVLMSESEKYGLVYVDDEAKAQQITKGVITDFPVLTAARKTSFACDFLKYTYSSDIADKFCKLAVPVVSAFAAVMTIVCTLFYHSSMQTVSAGFILSVFSLFLSAGSCFAVPLIVNLPLSNAAADAEHNESLILGYQSIDDFYDTNSVIIDSTQIFPENTVKLTAIKIFSDTKIDDAIIAAASLTHCANSVLFHIFNKIIDGKISMLNKVENYSFEDSMGLCGWIKNKRILLGTRQLMTNHNIEGLPPKSKEKDLIGKGRIALYLSISGNLSAMYVLKVKPDASVKRHLHKLIDNNICLMIRSMDSITTINRVSRLYDIPEDMIKIIPSDVHEYCQTLTDQVPRMSSSVVCTGTLSSITKALTNIKAVHQSVMTGIILQCTSVIIGLFITLAFVFLGAINEVTPLMILLYNLVWTLITIIISKIKPR